MSDIKKNKEKQLYIAPKSDEKVAEETPNTPTSESSSLSSDKVGSQARFTDTSSMTSVANEDWTEFELEPATETHEELRLSGDERSSKAELLSKFEPMSEPMPKPVSEDLSGVGAFPAAGVSGEVRPPPLQLGKEVLGIQSPLPGVRIRANRTLAIHGHFKGPSSTAASLLAFRFDLSTHSTSSKMDRFRSLQVRLIFDQHRDNSTVSIIGFEPASIGRVFRTETKSRDSGAVRVDLASSISVPTSALSRSAEVRVEREKTSSYEVRAIYQIEGNVSYSAERPYGPPGIVEWAVMENSREQLGIGLSFSGAVLVRRNTDTPFTVGIEMGVELSRMQRSKFFSRSRVTYDPNRDHGRPPPTISKDYLGNENARHSLLKLVLEQQVHEPLSSFQW
jgi:hypothetical protein